MAKRRLVVGMSGSSSPIYGIRLLEVLRDLDIETHLVLTKGAMQTIRLETGTAIEDVIQMASVVHESDNLAAPISSGSFLVEGMVVAPCSMKTLSAIAHSYSDDLVARAADVNLKERRKLVLVPRETPLHLGHLRNMVAVAEMGGIILPPMPAFYHRPKTIGDIVDQTIGKILDQFHIEHQLFQRWTGPAEPTSSD